MKTAGERHSNLTLAAFAAPCLPLAALGLPLVVHLPPYYHEEVGLSLGAIGTAWMVIRLLDLAFDPIFGGIMDRTRTQWGRFRFWFTLGVPLVLVASYMMFMAPGAERAADGSVIRPGVSLTYLWIGLLLIYAAQSITTLSQMSWAAVLSPNYDERSRIYGWWQAANVIGMILVLLLPSLLEGAGLSRAQGVQAMGWMIIILLPLTVGLALAKVPEPRVKAERDKAGLREYWNLLKRPSVRRLLFADLLIGTGPAITGALFFFYFLTIKEFESAAANVLLLFYFVGAFAGGPLWMKISYRLGKHMTLAVAAIAYACIQIGVFIMPAGNFPVSAVLMFLAGLPFSAGPFLLRAMMADIGDEERLATGMDRTGLLYAILTGTVKIGSALAVFITYQGLDMVGFDAKAGPSNPESALVGLQGFFTFAPAALGVATAALMFGYPLTAARQKEIRQQLDDRDLAEAAPEFGSKPRLNDELPLAGVKPIAAGE